MTEATFMTHPRPEAGVSPAALALAPWFHNLHLPDGTQTAPEHPLGDFPRCKWQQIAPCLPEDLHGWTALDIGCNAGFYAIELAARGARVTGIDKDPHFLKQARWAIQAFGLEEQIELCQAQVYDLAHSRDRFDLVLFLGVFYHLRYPLLGLDIVAEKVNRLLVFQTLTMPGEEVFTTAEDYDIGQREVLHAEGWPKLAFIEKALAGDPSNWWAPNHACVEALLRSTGLRLIARPGHEIYLCEPDGPALTRSWDSEELLSATGRTANRLLPP